MLYVNEMQVEFIVMCITCFVQTDLLRCMANSKPTVNDEDLQKLKKFTDDFGQEG